MSDYLNMSSGYVSMWDYFFQPIMILIRVSNITWTLMDILTWVQKTFYRHQIPLKDLYFISVVTYVDSGFVRFFEQLVLLPSVPQSWKSCHLIFVGKTDWKHAFIPTRKTSFYLGANIFLLNVSRFDTTPINLTTFILIRPFFLLVD